MKLITKLVGLGGSYANPFIFCCIDSCLDSFVSAEPLTVEKFLRDYGKNESFDHPYLLGITQGFEVANDELWEHKQPRVFCIPSRLTFTGERSHEVLKRFIEKYPPVEKALVPVAMLEALKDAYPCGR